MKGVMRIKAMLKQARQYPAPFRVTDGAWSPGSSPG
jgi:hypothetical protein